MSSTKEESANDEEAEKLQKQKQAAQHYLENVSRFTVMHAKDLILLISPQIESATTVLDVGCGPGTFGLAYLEAYPRGIAGQTVVFTDLSPGMVAIAKETLEARVPPDYQTAFKFQVEDGLTLQGIPDDSVDVVVSVFGIFIIPDYQQTLDSIRRILNSNNPNALFGTACWTMTEQLKQLEEEGFGPSFHQLIEESLMELTSLHSKDSKQEPPWKRWFDPSRAQQMVVDDAGYDKACFQSHRILHSVVWRSAEAMWTMISTNPMSKMHQAPPEKIQSAKQNLFRALQREGQDDNRPIVVSTASNLFLAKP